MSDSQDRDQPPAEVRQEGGGVVIQDGAEVHARDIVGRDKIVQVYVNLADLVKPAWERLASWQTLVIIALLITAVVAVRWWRARLPVMTGDFNVAVARVRPFGDGSPEANAASEEIQSYLRSTLREELDNTPLGDQAQVDALPRVVSDEDAARQLAQQTRAHLLIYGELAAPDTTGRGRFYPKFYVNENLEAQAEILGASSLGAMIPFSDYGELLARDLPPRAETLAFFTVGLVQLLARDYDAASDSFESAVRSFDQALAASPDKDLQGKEVLLYFKGAALAERGEPGDLDLARQTFEAALQARSEEPYVRTHLGLGNVLVREFQGAKLKRISYLDEAISNYEQVLEAQRVSNYVRLRAQFNLGEAHRLKAEHLKTPAFFEGAIAAWQEILDFYQAQRPSGLAALLARWAGSSEPAWLRALAGTTHLKLGHVYRSRATMAPSGQPAATANADLAKAAGEYELALPLLTDPDLRAEAQRGLGETYLLRAKRGGAEYYAEAVNRFEMLVTPPDALDSPTVREGRARASWGLGQAYEGQGQTQRAIEAYREGLELKTEDSLRPARLGSAEAAI